MFIVSPSEQMTYVHVTSNVALMVSKVERYAPGRVHLLTVVDASRGAVAEVQRTLNGARAHHNWFDGLLTVDDAERMVSDAETEFVRPRTEEWRSFKFEVPRDIELVGTSDDVDVAREAWSRVNAALDAMEQRVVVDAHKKFIERCRDELDAAVTSRSA